MSYREENGQVVLTMSREDYERVLLRLGTALGSNFGRNIRLADELSFLDRLNEGNPNYRPYTETAPLPPTG